MWFATKCPDRRLPSSVIRTNVTPVLVVLNGPIAAGKSTLAACLADEIRAADHSVAVVGLDEVFFMVRGLPNASLDDWWDLARAAHSRLVRAFISSGVEVVIVDGPFHDDCERRMLLADLDLDHSPVWITLAVSYEEARRRVAGDETRGLSKDPGFLRTAHDSFWSGHRSSGDPGPTFDTGEISSRELARTIIPDVLDVIRSADERPRSRSTTHPGAPVQQPDARP